MTQNPARAGSQARRSMRTHSNDCDAASTTPAGCRRLWHPRRARRACEERRGAKGPRKRRAGVRGGAPTYRSFAIYCSNTAANNRGQRTDAAKAHAHDPAQRHTCHRTGARAAEPPHGRSSHSHSGRSGLQPGHDVRGTGPRVGRAKELGPRLHPRPPGQRLAPPGAASLLPRTGGVRSDASRAVTSAPDW